MQGVIEIVQGDITKIQADAIVNAANSSLLGGSGVDGAIHKNGGKEILEACVKIRNRQGGCKVGEAVITTAGKLPAKFVIHAVGPVWNKGNDQEKELLSRTYTSCLKLAVENHIHTIAFPNISTGVYRFPKKEAAILAIETVQNFLATTNVIRKVIFVCFDIENYKLYISLLGEQSI